MPIISLETKSKVKLNEFCDRLVVLLRQDAETNKNRWHWGADEISSVAKRSFGFGTSDLSEALNRLVKRSRICLRVAQQDGYSSLRVTFTLGENKNKKEEAKQ